MKVSERPIACNLTNAAQADRKRVLLAGLLAAVEAFSELPDGYALRFAWSEERIEALGAFVAFESSCCPFMRFELHVEPDRGAVWLKLSSADKSKVFLRNELSAHPKFAEAMPPEADNSGGLARLGALFSVSGLAAFVCCVVPAVGVAGVSAGVGAAYFDIGAAISLLVGVVLLCAALWSRRRRRALVECRHGC